VPGREHLIESHLPLVRSIAKRYAGRGEALDDLVQVGAIALIRASDRFDPGRGVAFATFATPAIEGEIRRHLDERTSSLRIPRELQRMSGELQRCRAELGALLGRPPTVPELARELGIEDADVERALEAERARQPTSASPDDATEARAEPGSLASTDDRLLLEYGARVLDERERRIVFLRFHADLTEDDIARELGISQAHVSRLLAGALGKLRAELAGEETGKAAGRATARRRAKPRMASVGARSEKSSGQQARSTHSGRFLVRMPGALHEELSVAAERERVSLNRFVTDVLATAVSPTQAATASPSSKTEAAPKGEADSPPGPTASERSARLRMLLVANVLVIVLAGAAALVLLILAIQRGL
jgi:RNA polymerase sigma-B factor